MTKSKKAPWKILQGTDKKYINSTVGMRLDAKEKKLLGIAYGLMNDRHRGRKTWLTIFSRNPPILSHVWKTRKARYAALEKFIRTC